MSSDKPAELPTVVLPPGEQVPASKRGRPAGQGTSRAARKRQRKRLALGMLARGCSLTTTAAASGASLAAVKEYRRELAAVFPELEKVEQFRACKGDIVDAALAGVLKSMASREKLERSSLNGAAFAAKALNEIGRLERGLSTANVASFVKLQLPD